jgi:hypothetical protein
MCVKELIHVPVAEFSEAQFQFDLVFELIRKNRGQCSGTFHPTTNEEGKLGYDVALYSDHIRELLTDGSCGVPLTVEHGNARQVVGSHGGHIPCVWANVFLQMKRPVFIVGWERSISACMKSPHYRIELNPNQINQLAELEWHTRQFAIVRVAAPVFHTIDELMEHRWKCAVAQNTHFVSPGALKSGIMSCGHGISFMYPDPERESHHYAYTDAITFGKVLSEPENVTPDALATSLERMLSEAEPRLLSGYMKDLRDAVVKAVPPYRHDVPALAEQMADKVVEPIRDKLFGDGDYCWLPDNGESVIDVIKHMIIVEMLAAKVWNARCLLASASGPGESNEVT